MGYGQSDTLSPVKCFCFSLIVNIVQMEIPVSILAILSLDFLSKLGKRSVKHNQHGDGRHCLLPLHPRRQLTIDMNRYFALVGLRRSPVHKARDDKS